MSIIRNGDKIISNRITSVNLTLAEYEALPDSKFTDGVYYNIIESNEIPEDETINGNKNFTGTVKVKGNEVVTYEIINGNNCKVVKHIVGSLCTLDIYIDATSNISAWANLCSVPEPKSSNVGFLVNNSTSYRLYVSKNYKVLQNADTVIPSGVYTGSVTYEMA